MIDATKAISLREGMRRKGEALDKLESANAAHMRKAQRVMVERALQVGRVAIDDVRQEVKLPPGANPKWFGSIHRALKRAGIIRKIGTTPTTRPEAHGRDVAVWGIADRAKAIAWLESHPELPRPDDGPRRQLSLLPNEKAPAVAAAGREQRGGQQ